MSESRSAVEFRAVIVDRSAAELARTIANYPVAQFFSDMPQDAD